MSSDLAAELQKALGGEESQEEFGEQKTEVTEPTEPDEPTQVQEESDEPQETGESTDSSLVSADSDELPPYVQKAPKQESGEAEDEQASDDDTVLLNYVKEELGEDLGGKYATDDDLLRGLINASKLVGKREDDAQKWRSLAASPEETLRSWGYTREQARDAQGEAQQQQQPQGNVSGTVEFDENWMQMVERDEAGQIVGTKQGVDPAIANKLRAAEKFATERYRDMIFNPEKVISPILEQERDKIRTEVMQSLQAEMQQQQVATQAWDYLNSDANRAWIFNGGDISSGLSPDGMRFKGYIEEATERGYNPNDVSGLAGYATEKMEMDWHRSRMGKASPPMQVAASQANVAQPQETDIDTELRENETLEDALFRVTGVDPTRRR